jgi:NAD(P)-dependent dehydrogenase (short-subunit alcohol dehydrogenase family)
MPAQCGPPKAVGSSSEVDGRWAKPQDIAGTAIWLASPASDYVTGVAIEVDGGFASCLL